MIRLTILSVHFSPERSIGHVFTLCTHLDELTLPHPSTIKQKRTKIPNYLRCNFQTTCLQLATGALSGCRYSTTTTTTWLHVWGAMHSCDSCGNLYNDHATYRALFQFFSNEIQKCGLGEKKINVFVFLPKNVSLLLLGTHSFFSCSLSQNK